MVFKFFLRSSVFILFALSVPLAISSVRRLQHEKQENILLIGDSIDRVTVLDWCEYQARLGFNAIGSLWGSDTIKYGQGHKQPSLTCKSSSGDRLSFLHIFGSHWNGPYARAPPIGDRYYNTISRVGKACELFQEQIGNPTKVFFHSISWDLLKFVDSNSILKPEDAQWNATLENFKSDTIERVEQIRIMFPSPTVQIGLRTASRTEHESPMKEAFNDIVRQIVKEYPSVPSLLLYDMDIDDWSVVGFDRLRSSMVLRDPIHPTELFSSTAGEKILGRMYSANFLHFPAHIQVSDRVSLKPVIHHSANISCSSDVQFYLFRGVHFHSSNEIKMNKTEEEKIYYSICVNGSRYKWELEDVTSGMMSLRLGPGDIFPIPFKDLISIRFHPSGNLMPQNLTKIMIDTTVTKGFISQSNTPYILFHRYGMREVKVVGGPEVSLLSFGIKANDIYKEIPDVLLNLYTSPRIQAVLYVELKVEATLVPILDNLTIVDF